MIGCMSYCGVLTPEEASFTDLVILQVSFMVSSVFLGIVGPAMLHDTVDYGRLSSESGARGVYFALYSFMIKVEVALGISAGLALAGWLGFDAGSTEQTSEGVFAIHFAMCWLPMVITAMGLYFIFKLPLNEARMEVISRRLEKRAQSIQVL